MTLLEMLEGLWEETGIYHSFIFSDEGIAFGWQNYVMILLSFILFYLAISKKFEPLLLVPIAVGVLLANIPGAHDVLAAEPTSTMTANGEVTIAGGLFYYLMKGVELVIYPPIIFMGVGAMIDFGPMIADPKSMLLGVGAQAGIFVALIGGFIIFKDPELAASVAMIGGADGPTTIYVTVTLGQTEKLAGIAIAAYSYMALIPAIQPPFMKLLTTKKERRIKMKQMRKVSRKERIILPIAVIAFTGIALPSALPLLGMLMFGNLLRECLVTERLAKAASNELINIVTIFLGVCVGFKAQSGEFLTPATLGIIALGLTAFIFGTCGGILTAKLMNLFLKEKINPLLGSAGVSAVPMAARVSQKVALEEDCNNHLLMHAMAPNVSGTIASAVVAGVLLSVFGT